jgi:hypothetical protein
MLPDFYKLFLRGSCIFLTPCGGTMEVRATPVCLFGETMTIPLSGTPALIAEAVSQRLACG